MSKSRKGLVEQERDQAVRRLMQDFRGIKNLRSKLLECYKREIWDKQEFYAGVPQETIDEQFRMNFIKEKETGIFDQDTISNMMNINATEFTDAINTFDDLIQKKALSKNDKKKLKLFKMYDEFLQRMPPDRIQVSFELKKEIILLWMLLNNFVIEQEAIFGLKKISGKIKSAISILSVYYVLLLKRLIPYNQRNQTLIVIANTYYIYNPTDTVVQLNELNGYNIKFKGFFKKDFDVIYGGAQLIVPENIEISAEEVEDLQRLYNEYRHQLAELQTEEVKRASVFYVKFKNKYRQEDVARMFGVQRQKVVLGHAILKQAMSSSRSTYNIQEQHKNPVEPARSRAESETKIDTNLYFPQRRGVDMSRLTITEEGVYSITKPSEARNMMSVINEIVIKPENKVIFDATGGNGADVIAFQQVFKKVITSEINKENYDAIINNISVYGIQDTIDVYHNDSMEFIRNPRWLIENDISVVYIDPPWGGTGYKNERDIELKLNDSLVENIVANYLSDIEYIFIKIPRKNYNTERFTRNANITTVFYVDVHDISNDKRTVFKLISLVKK